MHSNYDYLASLTKLINPQSPRNLIIFAGNYSPDLVPSIKGLIKHNPSSGPLIELPGLPKMYEVPQTGIIIADYQKNLLNYDQNTLEEQCLMNLLDIFSLASQIRILFVFSDAQTSHEGKTDIIQTLTSLSSTLGRNLSDRSSNQLNAVLDKISRSIGLIVSEPKADVSIEQYANRFESVRGAKALPKDGNKLIQNTMNSILSQRRIFLLSNNDEQNLITNLMKKIKPVAFEEKSLQTLFKYSMTKKQQQCLIKMNEQLKERSTQLLSKFGKLIEDNVFLEEDGTAFQGIYNILCDKDIKLVKQQQFNPHKNIDQGMIVALFLFQDLGQLSVNLPLPLPTQISIVGEVTKKFASYKFITGAEKKQIPKLEQVGEFANHMKHFLSIAPVSIFEQSEKTTHWELLEGLVEKLMMFISEQFDDWFQKVRNSMGGPPYIKFLTSCMKGLEAAIKARSHIMGSQRMHDLHLKAETIMNILPIYLIEIKHIYIGKMKNFLSAQQKNQFYFQLESEVAQSIDQLKNNKPGLGFEVVKQIYQHFGDQCLQHQSFDIAVKLFKTGKLYYRLANAYRGWLDKNYSRDQAQINYQDIQDAISTLGKLGMVEQARNWCYKFIEKFSFENSQNIYYFLCNMATQFKEDHEEFLDSMKIEIEILQRSEISIVKDVLGG